MLFPHIIIQLQNLPLQLSQNRRLQILMICPSDEPVVHMSEVAGKTVSNHSLLQECSWLPSFWTVGLHTRVATHYICSYLPVLLVYDVHTLTRFVEVGISRVLFRADTVVHRHLQVHVGQTLF